MELIAPRFLGLSPGRSGSRSLARALNEAGIPTLHERNLSPPAWVAQGALGEVSAHLVHQTATWPSANVFHFTRHPQAFVPSLLSFGFWEMKAPLIHPRLRRSGSAVVDSFRYWMDWNEHLLTVSEPRRFTFRIEDFGEQHLREMAFRLGLPCRPVAVVPWQEGQSHVAVPAEVEAELLPLAARLGYTLTDLEEERAA